MTDVQLTFKDEYFDISFTSDGQLELDSGFDTAILYSLYGEKRANEAEIPAANRRRGWIGNESLPYENGSKLWLFYQARLTRSVLNSIRNETKNALEWFVEDGLAEKIDEPVVEVTSLGVEVTATIRYTQSNIKTETFLLWSNTGN